jgi:hypothetical protein
MEEPQSLDGRLGKLEGLMLGLQTSITQSQAHFAAYASRIESLEKRQIDLERQMITRADLTALLEKVDTITRQQSTAQGGADATKWSIQQILTVAATLVAAAALAITLVDRNPPDPPHLQRFGQQR